MKLPQLCSAPDFDERWLEPGAVVPVIPPNLGAALREVQRLREVISEAVIDAEKWRALGCIGYIPKCSYTVKWWGDGEKLPEGATPVYAPATGPSEREAK